jgi:ABC-2 type transport system ATP-binding protein
MESSAMADPVPSAPGGSGIQPAIQAAGLVKTFGEIRAVDGVGFDLAPGRIYGLLGPNGSGKTTLIRLLTGMARATAGEARILGVRMPSRANLGRIGYMTQSDGVYPALTVGENARFFADAYGVTDDAAVVDALTLVELADRQRSITATLSGGQRRRLSLACALTHRPPVLFLDEPTVGIDPLLRVQFWGHFRELTRAGTTIVVSSHVMDEADRCDELLFMRSGRVIARGTGRELRDRAGTDDLEQAFLRYADDNGVTR